jgi:peptide methionine sulfoxide reductase MsrA
VGLPLLAGALMRPPPAGAAPGPLDYALDFADQVKMELFGAKNEFEPLVVEQQQELLTSLAPPTAKKAYFALGCYWGAEAVFRCTKGVVATRVGFMGGQKQNPTYEDIGDHLEVVEVTYTGGPEAYERLLKIVGRTYDYEDVGNRYKRAIFAAGEEQSAQASLKGKTWSRTVVKPVDSTFFTPAKLEHQAYTRPRCPDAVPNVALVQAGLRRTKDHLHYATDCPNCALAADEQRGGFS